MSDVGKRVTSFKDLWQRFEKTDKEIVHSLVYATPPVSLDTLIALSGSSAVIVLNVMEELKKRKVVSETKSNKRGFYIINDNTFADFVKGCDDKELTDQLAPRIIDYYDRALDNSKEKTIILADLYLQLGAVEDGMQYIKEAADILFQSEEKEKAFLYYNHLIRCFETKEPSEATVGDFLASAIREAIILFYKIPIHRHIPLLMRSHEIAQRYGRQNELAMIKLLLGRLFQESGQPEKSSKYMHEFLKLSENSDNIDMPRDATLFLCEYFVRKGLLSEAIRRYEKIIDDLERFGNNEPVLMACSLVGISHVECGRIARGMGIIDAVRSKAIQLGLQRTASFCDVASTCCFLELRKPLEAEAYLNRLSSVSEELLGPHLSWIYNDCLAHIACMNGDFHKAFEYLKNGLKHSRFIAQTHRAQPIVLETLLALDLKGIVDEEVNLDSAVSNALKWDDIFLKGVALRYRAIRNLDKHKTSKNTLSDLQESEKCLKRSGAEIELARTRIALEEYYRVNNDPDKAQSYREKAMKFFSTIDQSFLPKDILMIMSNEKRTVMIMEMITKINESLGTIKNASSFLDKVINLAMDFTTAKRGAYITIVSGEITTIASRNLDVTLMNEYNSDKLLSYLRNATQEGLDFMQPGAEVCSASEPNLWFSKAMHLLCVPVISSNNVLGFLCLDSPLSGKPFTQDQITLVKMLCSQIAVGLSNIDMYNEMKELKDRYEEEAIFYRQEMGMAAPVETIIGQAKSIVKVINQIHQVAPTDSSVLILGETGVGKELVAKAIHNLSKRKDGPFIPVNLAVLPHELVAGELFGHEKGAFTGANERRKGRFELADGGTIFLDEIGDLPLSVQINLLRVLQEGVFERLGSAKPIESNFRVIAATNKDLRIEVEKGTFRDDLYYRLNVFPIYVTPLRERKEDIALLAHYFVDKYSKKLGKKILSIPSDEIRKLLYYHWPGNVRELKHFIERAVILSDGHGIDFSGFTQPSLQETSEERKPIRPLADIEKDYIISVLNVTGWRLSGPKGAAKLLGLKRETLRFRMKKLGIERPSPSRT